MEAISRPALGWETVTSPTNPKVERGGWESPYIFPPRILKPQPATPNPQPSTPNSESFSKQHDTQVVSAGFFTQFPVGDDNGSVGSCLACKLSRGHKTA